MDVNVDFSPTTVLQPVKVSLSFDLHLKETAITKNSLFCVVRTTSHLKRTHTNYTPVKITHCVMKRQTWVIFIC